jgi:FKBP-type peptidyl-prolyl cis-trans isomerase
VIGAVRFIDDGRGRRGAVYRRRYRRYDFPMHRARCFPALSALPSRVPSLAVLASLALLATATANGETDRKSPPVTAKRRADGLEIVDLEVGSGPVATSGKLAIVQLVGKLPDGRTFANTYETKRPLRFLIGKGQVIPGFEEAVLGMRVGGRRRAIVPPKLGYGERGFGTSVPPDSPLSFEIELVAVRDRP